MIIKQQGTLPQQSAVFFIVEKSVVMVYNEPLDYSGVMGDFVKSG